MATKAAAKSARKSTRKSTRKSAADRAAEASLGAPAKGKGKSAGAPTDEGKTDGEVRDGYRWDRAAGKWVEHTGTDFTKTPPAGHVALGDGTAERPHSVERVRNWHNA